MRLIILTYNLSGTLSELWWRIGQIVAFDNGMSLPSSWWNPELWTATCGFKNKKHHSVVWWTIYRVAKNKIPHQRICNISTTSSLIIGLNILEKQISNRQLWHHEPKQRGQGPLCYSGCWADNETTDRKGDVHLLLPTTQIEACASLSWSRA